MAKDGIKIPSIKEYNQKVNGPGLTPEDKISYKKQVLNAVANDRGWVKDNNLTKQNGRVVYTDPKDKNVFWSQDTQHGTFENMI